MSNAFESTIQTSRGPIEVWVHEIDRGYVTKVDGRRYPELSAVRPTGELALTVDAAKRQYLEAIETHWAATD